LWGYPGIGGMLHHGKNSIIKLVIVDVEHDLFGMQVRLLTRPNDFGYIDSRPKQFEMFHRLLRLVFRVEDGEFSEHGHMRSLKTQSSFHQCNQFVKEAVVFVLMDEFLQFLGMDNQVETADLSETEFSLVDTRLVDVLPDSDS
jgi:hypothetical protein